MSQMNRPTQIFSLFVASFVLVISVADTADAQRRRRGRRAAPQAQPQQAPNSAAIAPALGEIRWGMTNREVFNHFRTQIAARYNAQIADSHGAIEEDQLRHQMREEIQRVRRSYTRFNGQTSGWDVSFLRDEFTHRNNESMMVHRDGNSQNFYFFINDRLWKWYKAFDASVFQGQPFARFAASLQGRFGQAVDRSGRMTERGEEKRWLEWQDDSTRLRAIDENRFYGFYCLVFESEETLGQLDTLRTNRAQTRRGSHAMVDSIINDGQEVNMANQDIVDRITGNIRRRTNAPRMDEESSMGSSMSGRAQPASMRNAEVDDDPLRGLDL